MDNDRMMEELFKKSYGLQCPCGVSISFPAVWVICPKCDRNLFKVWKEKQKDALEARQE